MYFVMKSNWFEIWVSLLRIFFGIIVVGCWGGWGFFVVES